MGDSTPTPTPSAILAAAFKHVLTPKLRAVGFRGGPRQFFQLHPEVWLGFRINSMGTPFSASFTGDLGVASKLLLRTRGLDPVKPPPRQEWHHEQRIGSLLDTQFDRWWSIDAGQTIQHAEGVVADFAEVLIDQALPSLSPRLSNQGLLKVWRDDIDYLSPPEIGDLRDLERAMGETPTEPVRRPRGDSEAPLRATALAHVLEGLLDAVPGERRPSISVSDPNAPVRLALERGDLEGLTELLSSSSLGLGEREILDIIERLKGDPVLRRRGPERAD
jgi:hypothetical protein